MSMLNHILVDSEYQVHQPVIDPIRDGFRVESSRVRVEHRTGLPCSKLEIIEFDRADPFTRLELDNFDRAEGAVRLELDMLEI